MLFDQIAQQLAKRLAFLVFRQDPSDVARDRIGSSGSHLPVHSCELIFGQTDCDFRPGHTIIIPLLKRIKPIVCPVFAGLGVLSLQSHSAARCVGSSKQQRVAECVGSRPVEYPERRRRASLWF